MIENGRREPYQAPDPTTLVTKRPDHWPDQWPQARYFDVDVIRRAALQEQPEPRPRRLHALFRGFLVGVLIIAGILVAAAVGVLNGRGGP